jgi:HPP family
VPRGLNASRTAVVAAGSVVVVALADHYLRFPLLFTALGPTAYQLTFDPDHESSRLRNALAGHSVAILSGMAALAIFGLWTAVPLALTGPASLGRVGAVGIATAATLLVLEVGKLHHAPAGTTAILVATSLARPGPRLEGLCLGLLAVIILSTGATTLMRRMASASEGE